MSERHTTRLSVIVPVYETSLIFFKQCLDSLHTQTLLEAEFLIIFDGENVKLHSFCEEYKKKDDRFKIYVCPHAGVSATRNFGISQANGDYITFVDADDSLYINSTLQKAYKYQQFCNSDITYFNWISDKQPKILWSQDKSKLSSEEKDFFLQQNIHIQKPSFSGAPWAKIFRRSFLNENGIHFKETCTIGQDRVFNYEACIQARTISYCKDIFYKYEIISNSATQRFRSNFLPVILSYIEELYKLSNEKYHALIGREAMVIFYSSWEKCYMSPQNKKHFFPRMKELTNIVRSNRFQSLIQKVNTNNCSFLFKLETFLLRHKITFWIYLHGLQRSLIHFPYKKLTFFHKRH